MIRAIVYSLLLVTCGYVWGSYDPNTVTFSYGVEKDK
jgi:hypothetical protein